jgi:hypothetical protein
MVVGCADGLDRESSGRMPPSTDVVAGDLNALGVPAACMQMSNVSEFSLLEFEGQLPDKGGESGEGH